MDYKTDGGRGITRGRTPRDPPRGTGGRSRALSTLRVPVLRVLHTVQQEWARSDSTAYIHRQCLLVNPNVSQRAAMTAVRMQEERECMQDIRASGRVHRAALCSADTTCHHSGLQPRRTSPGVASYRQLDYLTSPSLPA